MNRTASRACRVLRKWLPTADCSTSLTRFSIVPTIEITLGARVSETWICTCRSMVNTNPSRLLPTIDSSRASRLCAWDAAVARAHDAAKLELRSRRVQCGQTDEGFDDGHLALADHEHRHQLDPY